MRLAIWSTTTPRQNSTHQELFRRQLDEIELAERIGIDRIWFYEHPLTPSAPVPSPNLLIAAAAQRTGRIRFASMVNILPFRNPLLAAEEAALLDNLTGGRLDMGIGRGLRPPEFDAFDIDQQRSREMFLEAFDVIRRVWADEEFEHRGRYWTVRKNGPLAPPLVQKPHPPFLVSAQSEESLRWAAQYDIPFAQIDSVVEQARRDQRGLAMIFKLGAMPYDTVEGSMRLFGEEVVPRIRHLLDGDGDGNPATASPALQPA